MGVFVITLGFAPARLLRRSFENYHRTRTEQDVSHVLVDQHYPLRKEQNREEVRAICEEFGVKIADPGKNLGLHHGFNFGLKASGAKPGDVVIALDPDSFPVTQGWDTALVRAIQVDPQRKVVWSTIMHPNCKNDILQAHKGYDERWADERRIKMWVMRLPVMNTTCAWDVEWLLSVGGLDEPRPFYGHLEANMFSKLGRKQWAFLPDFIETDELHLLHDPEYVRYKWAHSHTMKFNGDFEAYIAAGCPE